MCIRDRYKKMMQDDVNAIYVKFTSFIKKCRPKVSEEDMQGLTYDAPTALAKGFIDGIIEDPMELFVK